MPPETAATVDPVALATRLEEAWQRGTPIEPLSDTDGLITVEAAYAVQDAWTNLRLAAGETIVGRKTGLTSAAVQRQMGVDQPDYGTLWGSRHFETRGGRAEVPREQFIQPRVEGELAFIIADPPTGSEVTVDDVLAATEAIAPAIEIIDSRIVDWRIKIGDTIADNASYGGFLLGPPSRTLAQRDLREVEISITDGETTERGKGAAALGHPAYAVAWLLNTFAELGIEVRPGDIVLSGALAPTIAADRGGEFTLRVDDEQPLTLTLG